MSENFDIADNSIIIKTQELKPDVEQEFAECFQSMISTDSRVIVIDFSKVTYISSPYLGHLLRFHEEAVKNGKDLNVKISQKTSKMLTFAELHRLIPFKMYIV